MKHTTTTSIAALRVATSLAAPLDAQQAADMSVRAFVVNSKFNGQRVTSRAGQCFVARANSVLCTIRESIRAAAEKHHEALRARLAHYEAGKPWWQEMGER